MATGDDSERGSVTLFLVISVAGLLVLIGLIGDGGAKLRAGQHADQIAAEAARAAGQALNQPAVVAGEAAQVDRQAAVTAATAYLEATGNTGTVAPTARGTAIDVTVIITIPTVFLSLIGISELTATGHAQAGLVHAVTGGGP